MCLQNKNIIPMQEQNHQALQNYNKEKESLLSEKPHSSLDTAEHHTTGDTSNLSPYLSTQFNESNLLVNINDTSCTNGELNQERGVTITCAICRSDGNIYIIHPQ